MPRLTNGLEQVLTNLGIVGDGYKLFFYETGTTTLKSTYSDEDLTVPNTNPIVLNAAGRPDVDIWGSDPSLYRMILGTPDSVVGNITTIVDIDPVDNYQIDSIASLNPIPTAYWGTTAGTSTAYTLEEPLVDIVSYSNTQTFFLDFHIACGANPTLKIKDLDAIALKKYKGDGTTTNLIENDIRAQRYLCINNGTNIIVLNPNSLPILSGSDVALTIEAGVVTLTNNSSSYALDTEGAAAIDDLDTINGGQDGQIIFIKLLNAARKIYITSAGNIYPLGNVPNKLGNVNDIITLRYDASLSKWVSISGQFTAVGSSTGYTYSADGSIKQWGFESGIGATSNRTVVFPVTYPNSVTSIQLTLVTNDTINSSPLTAIQSTISTSGFTIRNNDSGGKSAYWETMGN